MTSWIVTDRVRKCEHLRRRREFTYHGLTRNDFFKVLHSDIELFELGFPQGTAHPDDAHRQAALIRGEDKDRTKRSFVGVDPFASEPFDYKHSAQQTDSWFLQLQPSHHLTSIHFTVLHSVLVKPKGGTAITASTLETLTQLEIHPPWSNSSPAMTASTDHRPASLCCSQQRTGPTSRILSSAGSAAHRPDGLIPTASRHQHSLTCLFVQLLADHSAANLAATASLRRRSSCLSLQRTAEPVHHFYPLL